MTLAQMENAAQSIRRWSFGMIKRMIVCDYMEQNRDGSREKWKGRADFFLCCLGFAVGLGNVWRFPYLCYRNGGGVFFIPYFICLFCCGIPLMALEMSVGQFSSTGPYHSWDFVRGFRGIGLCMTLVSLLACFYYNTVIGWAVYYFFASFSINGLPWATCGDWSTQFCQTRLHAINQSACRKAIDLTPYGNGTCYNNTSGTLYGIYDDNLAKMYGIRPVLPADEYLGYVGLQNKLSKGLSDIGGVRWDMALCILAAWFLVFCSLISGVKSLGNVAHISVLLPYIFLLILFFCGIFQEGSAKGLQFYLKPNVTKLADKTVWKDAATQIFFSSSLSLGGLTVLASFNRFHNDIIRDAVFCSICNSLTSVLSGFVIFSNIGGYAKSIGVPVDEVVTHGVELAFIVYAQACVHLPLANLWSIIFFASLILLGLDCAFSLLDAVIMCVIELRPKWNIYRRIILTALCLILFLFALTMATPGGLSIVALFDDNTMSYNILFLGLVECVAVSIYGPQRMAMDIETMIGQTTMGHLPWEKVKWWFMSCWSVISPVVLTLILGYSTFSKFNDKGKTKGKPVVQETIGWLILLGPLVPLLAIMISTYVNGEGNMGVKTADFILPTDTWGPYALKHRKLITYAEGFQLNPRQLPVEENDPLRSALRNPRSSIPYDDDTENEDQT